MGHYSVLKVGNEEISWKYEIPDYLSFIFDESELIAKYNKKEHNYKSIGYKTTCKDAIRRLESLGFNWELLLKVYEYFYENLVDSYLGALSWEIDFHFTNITHIETKKKFDDYESRLKTLSKKDQLVDFANFFGAIFRICSGGQEEIIKSLTGESYTLSTFTDDNGNVKYLGGIRDYFEDKILALPPWICVVSGLFEEDYLNKFNEILSVIQIKLLLHSYKDNEKVILELNDIVEEVSELEDFHNNSAKRLIDKIDLYNDFFNSILQRKDHIKEIYVKQQLSNIIQKIESLDKFENYKKGVLLEDLITIIVESIEGLEIIDRRLNNGDEEIDIVAKNNMLGTFWQSLISPCIFFECKNWKKKVGSAEIRDFEVKLQNHSKLVKLGVFISFNGFTKPVINELKRSSRSDYHIILITKQDITQLITSNMRIKDWFEKLITKFY